MVFRGLWAAHSRILQTDVLLRTKKSKAHYTRLHITVVAFRVSQDWLGCLGCGLLCSGKHLKSIYTDLSGHLALVFLLVSGSIQHLINLTLVFYSRWWNSLPEDFRCAHTSDIFYVPMKWQELLLEVSWVTSLCGCFSVCLFWIVLSPRKQIEALPCLTTVLVQYRSITECFVMLLFTPQQILFSCIICLLVSGAHPDGNFHISPVSHRHGQ